MVLPTIGVIRMASRPTGAMMKPAQGGGVAHVLLQPQRQQDDVAEEGAVAERERQRTDPEVAPGEEVQVDDGVAPR